MDQYYHNRALRKKMQPKYTPFISPSAHYEPRPGAKKKAEAATLDEFTQAEREVIYKYKIALDKNQRIAFYYATQHKVVDYENQRQIDRRNYNYLS